MFSNSGRTTTQLRFSSWGFTLVELLVVIAIIGVLLGLLLPAVQAAREAARRSECTNNLKQQGIALQNYHAQHSHFPPGATKHKIKDLVGLSWRVYVLPFMELQNIYELINPLPDGGGENLSAQGQIIETYHCPSADRPPNDPGLLKLANYAAVSGANKSNDPNNLVDVIDLEDFNCGDIRKSGLFYPQSNIRIAQITDGTSNTIAIGERLYSFRDWLSGVTWWGSSPSSPTGMCTGAAKNIHFPINADHFVFGFYKFDFQMPADGERKMRLNELPFASEHPGGAHFSFADSSVHFLNETIDFTVFQGLATRDGGEIFRSPL